METFILGVDGGGTSCRAVLVDGLGNLLGHCEGGPANPKAAGWQEARNVLSDLCVKVWHSAGLEPRPATAAFLGLAGLRLPIEQESYRQYLTPLRLAPQDKVLCDHDLRIAHEGGLLGKEGVVLVAGTGSAAYARDSKENSVRVGGWGWLIDDGGSTCWMGMEAIRAVARAADHRGPETSLTEIINREWGQESPDELPVNFYKNPLPREWVAKLAPMVFSAAAAGDTAAASIIDRGAEELADLAASAARRLNFGARIPIVVNGGLVKAGDAFLKPLSFALSRYIPNGDLVPPQLPPVLGAALLGLKLASIEPNDGIINNLRVAAKSIT